MEAVYGNSGYVSYEDFGAKGDGITDDIDAIKAAHDYANAHNITVKADPHATYYIGPRPMTAIIKTNVEWGSAKFIVDDTNVKLEDRNKSIFCVRSAYEPIELEIPSIRKNQMRLDIELPQNCYVKVENANKKQFIRYGLNQNNGSPQTDSFILDSTGYILDPVIWDFATVTKATAFPVDEIQLKISGGIFTTIANQAESKYNYHSRNIVVNRSNVLIEGLTHKITGETDHGAPYSGFITINNCAYVTVKDTFLTGHKIYGTIGSAGKPVMMGSYDLSINGSAKVRLENLRQNGIMDRTRWGLMGTNHCRDLYLDGCTMSRFDAHENVVNLTIRNTVLGHQCFNAIGHGQMLVENVIAYGYSFLNLRSDYGGSWDGDITFKNCTWYPSASNGSPFFIGGHNFGGHDFGFPCYMPHKVSIEGLRICDSGFTDEYKGAAIFNVSSSVMNGGEGIDHNDCTVLYPYRFTEELYMRDVVCESGKGIKIFSGDTAHCYAMHKHVVSPERILPNFRAIVENTELGSDSVVPTTELSAADYGENYRLVPRIELRNCRNMVYLNGNTPALIKVVDSEITKCEASESAKITIE